jgi:hypothetical protein
MEVARIKLAAEPVEHLPVFFVLGIFESLQEFVVALDAATVFRRTGVPSIQANRILLFRVSGQDLLDHYFMRPAAAKIVFVNKGCLFVSRDVSQAKTPFVKPLLAGVVIARRHRVNNWSIHELMQVAVSPSHNNLKDIVQAIEVVLPGT